jgi:hypothetical protein
VAFVTRSGEVVTFATRRNPHRKAAATRSRVKGRRSAMGDRGSRDFFARKSRGVSRAQKRRRATGSRRR